MENETTDTKTIRFHQFGEQAILINFEQRIEEPINLQVTLLDTAIHAANIPAIQYTIPAYCSLTVGYDPTLLDYKTLCLLISNLTISSKENSVQNPTRQLSIPVCYDQEFALDLEQVAKEKEITTKKVIQYHYQPIYKVFMLGFLPGFTFMGKILESISCKRKKEPRLKVPALSVGIAGEQTGIYPTESPGGWQILGRTPIPIFDATKEQPFLFQAGHKVKFYPISKKEFVMIQKDIESNSFNWQEIYG